MKMEIDMEVEIEIEMEMEILPLFAKTCRKHRQDCLFLWGQHFFEEIIGPIRIRVLFLEAISITA